MRTLAIFLALVLYLAIGVFPYVASFLLAPPVAVGAMLAVWAGGLVGMTLLARRRSWWVLAGPPLAIAFWAVVVTLGERLFGWTA